MVDRQSEDDGFIFKIFRWIGAEARIFVDTGNSRGRNCNTDFPLSKILSDRRLYLVPFYVDAANRSLQE